MNVFFILNLNWMAEMVKEVISWHQRIFRVVIFRAIQHLAGFLQSEKLRFGLNFVLISKRGRQKYLVHSVWANFDVFEVYQ